MSTMQLLISEKLILNIKLKQTATPTIKNIVMDYLIDLNGLE